MDSKVWAEIIKSAAQSNLGVLALMILVVCLLALVFFRQATERIRLGVFLLLFAGVALFTVSLISSTPKEGEAVTATKVQTPRERAIRTKAIEGIWYAEVSYSWGIRELERFEFTVDGERLLGTVSFGKSPRQIVDGRLSEDRLFFVTKLDDRTFQYKGEIGESQVQFTLNNKGEPPTQFVAARTVEEARRLRPRQPSGGTEPELSSIDGGPYELDYIKTKVSQLHTDIRQCYVDTEFDPVDHAYAYYFVKIARDGTVTETGSPGTDQRSVKLDRCMDRAFRNVNWGPPPGGQDAEITLGFKALPAWRSQ